MTRDFAVLVLSCDKYRDLWPPFLSQFRKYFPAVNWPIYFASNLIPCQEKGVIPLLSGQDHDWSTSCKKILGKIPERKLLVVLEDLFLSAPVDEGAFKKTVDFIIKKDANHVKYERIPMLDAPTDFPGFGKYFGGGPDRAQVSGFWDRECLKSLLLEGENPWAFELWGSCRAAYMDGFYGLTSALCVYRNMVEKGRWIPESIEWAKAAGIELNLESRPGVGRPYLLRRLQTVYFDLMLRIPWQLRVGLMNKLRKALVSY